MLELEVSTWEDKEARRRRETLIPGGNAADYRPRIRAMSQSHSNTEFILTIYYD